MDEELSLEQQIISDSNFTSAEAMSLASNCSSMEAKARFLQVAQMGNIAKAIIVASNNIHLGLKWVSDSIDKISAINQGTDEHEEITTEDDSEDGEEEDEPDPCDSLQLIPTLPRIRKRYVRTVDRLRLEKAE